MEWAGDRSGGVRAPFDARSGRPTGTQIETPLVLRLKRWANGLVAGEDVPRAILLVGGPGNGKTDAVVGCVELLDAALGSGGALVEMFRNEYLMGTDRYPPRKAVVDLSALPVHPPQHLKVSFSLVADATEGDPSTGERAEDLLLKDLADLLDPDRSGLFVCCVNRGILAHAAAIAHEDGRHPLAAELLTQITRCVTSGPDSPACWPLDGHKHIAVWPMDVESLVAPREDGGESVAHQIFRFSLEESRWNVPCELQGRCPFCQNRKILSRHGVLDSLIQLLHFYEVSAGKRWTFRDLFSLVPYLLVGDYSELEVRGKRLSPCGWAAEQHRLASEGPLGSPERDRAPFLLASRLFYHRLFPRWPTFDRGEHLSARRGVLVDQSDEGIRATQALLRFTSRAGQLTSLASGDVPSRVRDSLGPALDPAMATGDRVLFSRDREYTVADIENHFSLSAKHGLDLVRNQVEVLERDVLAHLVLADDALVEDKFPRNRTRQARLLQSTIRQFAARLVKRSLCTRKGICKDVDHFERYLVAARDPQAQNEARKELKRLLHDSTNKFRAGLATTFGQPVAERSRDVALVLPRMIAVLPVPVAAQDSRPRDPLPYLRVERHYVALTFHLFRALEQVSMGLHDASLPAEIYSLLDRVRSLVAGQVVRDPDVLNDDPHIVLGSSLDRIEFVGGRFNFTRGASP